MNLLNIKSFLLILILIVLNVDIINAQTKILEGFAQGTSYKILYYSNTNIKNESIKLILDQLDSSLSIYKNHSLISSFNQDNIEKIEMDEHLKKVIYSSFAHNKMSKGLFDITVGPLSKLYGLNEKRVSSFPYKHEIEQALKNVGLKQLIVDSEILIKKNKNIKIDVNGIAQGYSVDFLAEYLEQQNINNYLVELGGEIRTKGTHPDGRKFKIALEVPSFEENHWIVKNEVLEIYNCAITTSGGLDKKIGQQNIRSHINPKTGYPIKSKTLAATIITDFAIDADAIDNYLIAFSPKQAKKFLKKHKNVGAILIREDKKGKYKIIKYERSNV